jgi:transglutaminase-like putative cysteine protease
MVNFSKKFLIVILLCIAILSVSSPADLRADTPYYTLNGERSYTIVHETTVTNESRSVVKDIKVTIPLMDSSMPLYQSYFGRQFSPWPNDILTSISGRQDGVYNIGRMDARETVTITQKYVVDCYRVDYDNFALSQMGENYDDDNIPAYCLAATKDVQSEDAEIIAFAENAANDADNPYAIAQNIFAAVNMYMTYTEGMQDQSALGALKSGKGSCEAYNNLFVASLRAMGIPSRQQSGYLFDSEKHLSEPYIDLANNRLKLNTLRHTWAEFYLPHIGCLVADPTFTYTFTIGGVTNKFVNWDYFGSISGTKHYIFFRGTNGADDEIVYNNRDILVSFNAYLILGRDFSPFNDIKGHWAEQDIIYLVDNNLTNGIGGGMFGVSKLLTRAQLATFIQNIVDSPPGSRSFSDVPENYWAANAISAAQEAGWVNGYPDGTFRPEASVTRAELAFMFYRAFNVTEGDQEVSFNDLGRPGLGWADDAIMLLASNGYVQGMGNGNFEPQSKVTRAQAAAILARIHRSLENKEE